MRIPELSAQELGRPRSRFRNPILEGKLYVFRQPLYDVYQTKVGTACVKQTLFTVPQGQSYTPTGGTAYAKTAWHTNMVAAGVLPSPEKFFIKSLQVEFFGNTAVADANGFMNITLLQLLISQRSYAQESLSRFPQAGGLYGASSAIITNGYPDSRNFWSTYGELGETIEQLQTINIILDPTQAIDSEGGTTYTTAAAAANGVGLNAKVHLDGLLHREVL